MRKKVFVAGATGVLGRRVVRQLVSKGYHVVGLSRSSQNTEWLTENGAESRSGDIFDEESMLKAVSGCDVVLHLATAIPTKGRMSLKDWAANDRIRLQGTKSLVSAALRNNCKLYVQQSITFIYGDKGGEWVDETVDIPDRQVRTLRSAVDMEHIVQDATAKEGLPAIILRFGFFYCYDSSQTRAMFEMARKGLFPIIGDGKAYWNIINVDDAAASVISAVENHAGNSGEIFNVCDDEPVTFGDLANYIAKTLGARRPFHIPPFLARAALGSYTVDVLTASVCCKNGKIKERLGWKPKYPTYREGYKAEIKKWLKEGA